MVGCHVRLRPLQVAGLRLRVSFDGCRQHMGRRAHAPGLPIVGGHSPRRKDWHKVRRFGTIVHDHPRLVLQGPKQKQVMRDVSKGLPPQSALVLQTPEQGLALAGVQADRHHRRNILHLCENSVPTSAMMRALRFRRRLCACRPFAMGWTARRALRFRCRLCAWRPFDRC